MALKVTSWPQALSYRVAYQDNATNTASSHISGVPGSFYAVIIDNSQGTDECFLKLVDGITATPGTTDPDWMLRCGSGKIETWSIPEGMPFGHGRSFWLTRNEVYTDTTVPAVATNGTVKVTVQVSSS